MTPRPRALWVGATMAGAIAIAACSGATGASTSSATRDSLVSRAAPNGRVILTPILNGYAAGWCMADSDEGSSGCDSVGPTSTGPIFAQGGCQGIAERSFEFLLTRSDVKAVSVDGGAPIPTTTNSTLPDGLRAAAIEVTGYSSTEHSLVCPPATPLDTDGKPITARGRRAVSLAYFLPEKRWEGPART